ncbi:hypothetical protein UFOVP889_16 [uncultured Caudovirales phage]|uniref:Uncharacterized protein n=1 Tax=uncultured Caudovirales phage TaxID=2100421 RepID=A0A6J5RCB8_9CAUD|nr:hypothetical protein UFOVP889_16 [uncultured Caudovirales phage]CAB4194659.1 hypothetical protein UFOVP1283_17 [uncultured Caudovirales phage]
MATNIITGRDITFTIDGDNFDAQATSATLTIDSTTNTYQTLDGKAYYTVDTQGTFAVELLQDFGKVGSLCEALWNAAANAANTTLPILFTVNGVAYTFTVMPVFPDLGGTAPDALTASLSFICATTPALD